MTSLSSGDSPSTAAQTISTIFAGRPTFEQVAQQMLEQALRETYPALAIDLGKVQLATPNEAAQGWNYQPFMPLVLDYLALGTPLDFSSQGELDCYLSDAVPRRLSWLDTKVVEKAARALPWTVPLGLEDALARYWNGDADTASLPQATDRTSRWQWLSDTLRTTLHIRRLQQPGLTVPACEALEQIVRWPERAQRFKHNASAVYAYGLNSILTKGASTSVLPSSDLLLEHYTEYGLTLLLCSPGAAIRAFESLDAFNRHWRERIANRYVVETITCQRYELGGHAFDTQAALILEQQLTELKTVKLPSRIGLANLNALYNDLSDPARYLRDAPRVTADTSTRLAPLLPDWLKSASLADRGRFQRYSLAQAGTGCRGRAQLSDIKAFTADALLRQMNKANESSPDKVDSSQYQPDDVQLIFTVSAGYPGTAGISEQRTMSLTRLAIDNLVARPSGHFKLTHRQGLPLPAWLTADFITRKNGLIEQVDIGTAYPRYLQQELLGDSSQAREHQRMFADQVPAQLPLEALQQMLTRKDGVTRQGLRFIEAVFQADAEGRNVGGQPVVMRHLAFLHKPQARPDIVSNMFIVDAQDAKTGPHLLYRPLYAPSLLEFPTREALLQAIATAGDLQTSVLTWMPDAARPVYANGGFLEPHIVRFLQGDEFTAPEKPAPATLAVDGASDELLQYLGQGELLQYLYGCNAQALVTQADRNSVSNSESRWAVLLEGGSLLFNALLFPLLRGPAMATVWLWSLMASASRDIPALMSEDPATRELAAVDFLVNLAMLASQLHASPVPPRVPIAESLMEQAIEPPAPRVIAEQWPAPPQPKTLEGSVTLPDAHSGVLDRTLDFSFASARQQLSPSQREQLLRMQVSRPDPLPTPSQFGPLTGLYVIDNKWHSLVDGKLFRISPEDDGSATIVDPLDPLKTGPALQSDGRGNWSLDLGLRLRGGMPPKRIAEQRRLKDQRRRELNDELASFALQQPNQYAALKVAEQDLKKFEEGSIYTEAQRAPVRQTFYTLIEQQIDIRRQLLDSMPERDELNISLPASRVRELMGDVASYAGIASEATHTEHQAFNEANPRFSENFMPDVAIMNREGYLRYLETTLDINTRRIRWLELNEEYLEKLLNQGSSGAKEYRRLTKNRPSDTINSITAKSLQMSTLNLLSLRRSGGLAEYMYRIFEPLGKQVRTHSELHTYELTPSDELEVLESLSEQYARALDHLQGMRTLYPDDINPPYFSRLTALVESLYQDASSKLAIQVKPEPEPERVKQPPKRPNAAEGRPRKKVIKTRNNGVLIGDFKPAGTSLPIDVVELRSDINDEVVATYSLHEDVWDPVDVRKPEPAAAPVPAPAPRTRRVETISRDARKLLGQLEQRLRRAEDYKTRCRYPQEIEEILNNEASRFRVLSDELDNAIASSQTPRTPEEGALSIQLKDAITRLTNRGSTLRTELSLSLPPTDGNLRYLFEKDLIQVARLGERKTLAGARKDFLQEYAVNDRDGFPLWYAHFHYEAMDAPKADYTVAHLKTKAQRREHYHSLLAKANNPYAVIDVHRGQIGRSLAQSRFLPLAP
ncbi:hypothetical protein J3P85_15255 [Pseudomonas sp. Z1-12]|uniref:dermonecrotic toxin domain-containing protein n=1 Tax=Pseudomonas sp. Z1-12 TaxID=2817408 RepID=UPI003DA9E4CC